MLLRHALSQWTGLEVAAADVQRPRSAVSKQVKTLFSTLPADSELFIIGTAVPFLPQIHVS
jgi:hypothetical protein